MILLVFVPLGLFAGPIRKMGGPPVEHGPGSQICPFTISWLINGGDTPKCTTNRYMVIWYQIDLSIILRRTSFLGPSKNTAGFLCHSYFGATVVELKNSCHQPTAIQSGSDGLMGNLAGANSHG